MIVKKFRGKTESEAKQKALRALGPELEVLMSRVVEGKGLFSKKNEVEITVAYDNDLEDEKEDRVTFAEPTEAKGEDFVDLSFQAKNQLQEPAQEEDDVLKQLRSRRSGKLEIKSEEEARNPTRKQVVELVKKETIEAQQSVSLGQKFEYLPFVNFLVNKGISHSLSLEMHRKVQSLFGDIDISKPSAERTACFQALKREIAAHIPCYGPICLDRYKTSYACFVGDASIGKFTCCAKIAMQYKRALDKRVGIVLYGDNDVLESKPKLFVDEVKQAGVRVEKASSMTDLGRLLNTLVDCDLVLITLNKEMNLHRNYQESLATMQSLIPELAIHLVLKASSSETQIKSALQSRVYTSYESFVVTKADKEEKLGTLVNLSSQIDLPLSYISCGGVLDEGLVIADGHEIAKKVLLEERYSISKSLRRSA